MQARSLILLKIADRIEQNLELLAITETWDNGKAIRETLNADIPLAADHSATSLAACALRKAALPKSTATPWPITSMNRWAWSARSSLELPAADGRVETRPGAGRRQLRGAQACRADSAGHLRTDGADR